MKKSIVLIFYITAGWLGIILLLSLVFSLNPLDFFRHTQTNIVLNVSYLVLLYGIILFLVNFKLKRDGKPGIKVLGLGKIKDGCIIIPTAAFFALFIFIVYIWLLVEFKVGKYNFPSWHQVIIEGMKAILLGFLFAFVEEVLFRGYILQSLMEEYPIPIAFTITNIFFALLHMFRPGNFVFKVFYFLGIFSVGLALSYILLISGTLWSCVAVHGGWIAGMYLLPTLVQYNEITFSHVAYIWGMERTPTAGLVGIAMIFATTAILGLIMRKRRACVQG